MSLRCPWCRTRRTYVASNQDVAARDAARSAFEIGRRRECRSCGHRFVTVERVVVDSLLEVTA